MRYPTLRIGLCVPALGMLIACAEPAPEPGLLPMADASVERGYDASTRPDGGPRDDGAVSGPADASAPPDAPFDGTTYYLSRDGANTDGLSWASAWNELDQIAWDAIAPGDRIVMEGGTYRTRLLPSRGGDATGRITLVRSTEPGHDGKVTFDFRETSLPDYWASMIRIESPYLTIDGGDWDEFEILAGFSCLFHIDTGNDDDHFELRNVRLTGQQIPDNGGAALCINSGSVRLRRVWFGPQVGAEDHIKLLTSSHTSLDIQESVFTPWITIDGSHSDLIEQCWAGCEAGDLTFKHNLIWDSGPGGQNIAFTLDPHWANIDVSYNVFKNVGYLFQFTSPGTVRISNNVFYDVSGTVGGDGDWEVVNNIFYAEPDNTNIVWGTMPRHSLWIPGTYGYFAGDGTNLEADPNFLDPTAILGADGIPFTGDDGFQLQEGSPAIDQGAATIDGADIRGTTIVGRPDIGAYERN